MFIIEKTQRARKVYIVILCYPVNFFENLKLLKKKKKGLLVKKKKEKR